VQLIVELVCGWGQLRIRVKSSNFRGRKSFAHAIGVPKTGDSGTFATVFKVFEFSTVVLRLFRTYWKRVWVASEIKTAWSAVSVTARR
jgi:hypothetical protein